MSCSVSLRERYGQKHKIINAYMKSLLDLSPPQSNLFSLREFYDTAESYIRGLESLGQEEETFGTMLIPILMDKLPSDLKINITRHNGSDHWTLESLRRCILHEITILEAGSSNSSLNNVLLTANFHTSARSSKEKSNRNITPFQRSPKKCVYCKENHFPGDCPLDYNKRLAIVKEHKLCFNSLGHHQVSKCQSKGTCRNCHKKHHTSLCRKNSNSDNVTNTEHQSQKSTDISVDSSIIQEIAQSQNVDDESVLHSTSTSVTLLKTAVATVSSSPSANSFTCANILFDEGAQRSFITEELANNLQAEVSGNESLNIAAFGDKTAKSVRHLNKTTVYVETDSGEKVPVEVLIVPNIAAPIHTNRVSVNSLPHLKNLKLAHPENSDTSFSVSLLIGADFYWSFVGDEIIRGNGPTAVSSKLGYLISGPTRISNSTSKVQTSMHNVLTFHKNEEVNIARFWEIEDIGEKDGLLHEKAETYGQHSISFENGRYSAKLPWKDSCAELPTNEEIVRRRTKNVIKRLASDGDMLDIYSKIIQEQEARGFIEKVDISKDTNSTRKHYIPHHPVAKDSSTTAIRIVYDCSCRMNGKSPSLNDCLDSTAPDLNNLTGIILRFRAKQYAVTTDIEKAFLQINLDKSDRNVTRFFWLSNPQDPTSALTVYRFKVVLFGATCSPFILGATLLKHFDRNPCETSMELLESLYVDNVLTSFPDQSTLLKFYKDSRVLLQNGGFNLRSWNSNNHTLRELAKEENVLDTDEQIKILGMRWDCETDYLKFPQLKLKTYPEGENGEITKREVLRESSKIFDPLGLLSPVTVRAKIFMQDIWKLECSWDQCLPHEFQENWKSLALDLQECTNIEIQRYLHTDSKETPALHVFTDASQRAYGACAYLVTKDTSCLVMAKNRVAPIKSQTLPRLELMGAVIGAKIANHLKTVLNVQTVTFWCDSQIVLSWLTSLKDLKPFVRKRVKEITDLTEGSVWKYCPTKSNPADCLTRGETAEKFLSNKLWMNGPKWIHDESAWPIWNRSTDTSSSAVLKVDCELSTTDTCTESVKTTENTTVDASRFSSYSRLLRATAYVLRFIENCKTSKTQRKTSVLTAKELYNANVITLKETQRDVFKEEINNLSNQNSKRTAITKQLGLYLDNEGLLRCRGRIHNSSLDTETKFPVLLPKKHLVTRLIILKKHLVTRLIILKKHLVTRLIILNSHESVLHA
ncbi:uncharacterized protein LOC125676243 [Ostrea edulis]|uniref:uncharacterized protein LOC125676243 n=1 Tax=Ostrea edulis TaxID=37623 RepID=UPI0024AF9556|nr:uncharacterized protein LOC125676243 [Ostrea edulis]